MGAITLAVWSTFAWTEKFNWTELNWKKFILVFVTFVNRINIFKFLEEMGMYHNYLVVYWLLGGTYPFGFCSHFSWLQGLKSSHNSSRLINRRCAWTPASGELQSAGEGQSHVLFDQGTVHCEFCTVLISVHMNCLHQSIPNYSAHYCSKFTKK